MLHYVFLKQRMLRRDTMIEKGFYNLTDSQKKYLGYRIIF